LTENALSLAKHPKLLTAKAAIRRAFAMKTLMLYQTSIFGFAITVDALRDGTLARRSVRVASGKRQLSSRRGLGLNSASAGKRQSLRHKRPPTRGFDSPKAAALLELQQRGKNRRRRFSHGADISDPSIISSSAHEETAR
jgi:hypothetical protein